jgi:hypothetical protein
MTRVVMVPSSLRNGAVACRTVARETSASARRVKGFPAPQGLAPEDLAELRALAPQLQRAAIAAEREAIFLLTCSHLGLLADGPMSSLMGLVVPPLLSPWAMPVSPKRERPDLEGQDIGKGITDELGAIGKSLLDTSAGLLGHVLDSRGGHVSEQIPFIDKRKRELDDAASYIYHHPWDFTKEALKGAVAYDDFKHGRIGHGMGVAAVGIASFATPFTKAADAIRADRVAGEAAAAARDPKLLRDRAHSDVTKAQSDLDLRKKITPSRFDSEADNAERLRALHLKVAQSELALAKADEALAGPSGAAHAAAHHAVEAKQEAVSDIKKEIRNEAAIAANKTADERGEPAR